MSTPTILSNNATIYDAHGHIANQGVKVILVPATDTECETVAIGLDAHRADDLIITPTRITSKIAGWEVAL